MCNCRFCCKGENFAYFVVNNNEKDSRILIRSGRGGAIMKLKKEHIAFLNETARIDFDSALQMVDGVNMLAEVEYGLFI